MIDEGPTGIKAPDGGWGWAILWGCFVITGFSYAFPKAVSVFFKELMREFGIGYSDTAWISSILLAMLYGTGEQGLSCQVTTSASSPSSFLGKKPWGLGAGWCIQVSAALVPQRQLVGSPRGCHGLQRAGWHGQSCLRPCPEGRIRTAVLDPRAVLAACTDQSGEMPGDRCFT